MATIPSTNGPITVTFWGAAHTVTGSMHLVEAAEQRILLDCGLFQGRRAYAHCRNCDFPFAPAGIDAPRISSVVRQGGIYHEILEEAAAIKADLIVMTSHRPAMRTYFLGSNAGHVVRYAKCSVLVVRH